MTSLKPSVPTRLLFGTLIGLMTLSASASQASANLLPNGIPGASIINSVLGGPPQPTTQNILPGLDVLTDNVRQNSLDFCVVNCSGAMGPVPSPAPAPGFPPQARPPFPPQGRPPVPAPAAPPARPQIDLSLPL